jgi:hypothetical protein
MPEKIFEECVICRLWSSKNKMFENNPYCPIHYKERIDEVSDKRHFVSYQKFLNMLRNINAKISTEKENPNA